MFHGKVLFALVAIAVPALAQSPDLGGCAASVLVRANPLYEFSPPISGRFTTDVTFDSNLCAGYELIGNMFPVPFGARDFDGRFRTPFNTDGLFSNYVFDNAFIIDIGSSDYDDLSFTFDGQIVDPATNNRATVSSSGQPQTKVVAFSDAASVTACEQASVFEGFNSDTDTGALQETTFVYAANDATPFSMVYSNPRNGECRREMYVDWVISGDDGSSYTCDRFNPVVRPTPGQGTVNCQVAVGKLSPGVAYQFTRPGVTGERPNTGAVPLAPALPPVFRVARPPASILEQCGRSVLSDQQSSILISGSGSGQTFETGVQYSPLCEGLSFYLAVVLLLDGQEPSDFAPGNTQTFDPNPEGTNRAYYPFPTTIFQMSRANEMANFGVKWTFRGEVIDGTGNTYPIELGTQPEFRVIAEYADPNAADCESGIQFAGFALDENFNSVEASFQVSQYNSSSFTFDVSSYTNGVCRPEMYTDFFLSSDAGADIPCSRVNYPSKAEGRPGLQTSTCEIAWNALSTSALYTINFPDAPTDRPNSGAVPLAPSTRATFRVSQPGASVGPCVGSFVYTEPRFTYAFKSSESGGPVDPTNFMYMIDYDPALCNGLKLSGHLYRPAGGDNVAGSDYTLNADGRVTMEFDISVADMDNQMTDPKRPYQLSGEITLNIDGAIFSAEVEGPSFIFKYIEFPNVDRCAQTIAFPDLSPSFYEIGSVDFLTTDTDNFATRITYTNSGYCDRGQFIDLKLTNTGGSEYSCARHVPDDEFTGGGVITCERVKGTMSTLVVWKLSDLNPDLNFGKRRVGGVVYAGSQEFRVTHSDDAQATGGLRRRQRQVQAGLEVPSDIQCLPGHEICPVPGRLGSWECLDTTSMLDACGGCPQSGGKDCTEIAGISTVACEAGICIVKECDEEHALTKDASGCVPLTNSIRWSAI